MLEIPGGSRPAPGLRGVGTGRVELHDPLPGLDRLVEVALAGERGTLVVERAGVVRVEAKHPCEGLERLGRAAEIRRMTPATATWTATSVT